MYEPGGRQDQTFGSLRRGILTTTAGKPGLSMCSLLNAEWNEMSEDEVATGTRVATMISMRIMERQWSVNVESARSPYQRGPRRINGVVQMQVAVIQIFCSLATRKASCSWPLKKV